MAEKAIPMPLYAAENKEQSLKLSSYSLFIQRYYIFSICLFIPQKCEIKYIEFSQFFNHRFQSPLRLENHAQNLQKLHLLPFIPASPDSHQALFSQPSVLGQTSELIYLVIC